MSVRGLETEVELPQAEETVPGDASETIASPFPGDLPTDGPSTSFDGQTLDLQFLNASPGYDGTTLSRSDAMDFAEIAGVPNTLAQADNEERGAWLGLADRAGDAINSALDVLPSGVAEVLRNSPPDAVVVGAVINTPVGKAKAFIIQPNDLEAWPTVFIQPPGIDVVVTVNLGTGQVEVGPGGSQLIAPDTAAFYNGRIGGRAGDDPQGSISGNFGVVNSTLTDPLGDRAVGAAVRTIGKALSAIAYAVDAGTFPSGEGVAANVVISATAELLTGLLQRNVDWSAGVAWRGVDLVVNEDGDASVNLSGAEFDLPKTENEGGRRPGR